MSSGPGGILEEDVGKSLCSDISSIITEVEKCGPSSGTVTVQLSADPESMLTLGFMII